MSDLLPTQESDLERDLEEVAHLRLPVQKRIATELGEDFRLSDKQWRGLVASFGTSGSHDDMWVDDVALPEVRRIRAERQVPSTTRDEIRPYPTSDPRFDALSEVIALEASHDPGVIDWRKRYLSQEELPTVEQLGDVLDELRGLPPREQEATVLITSTVGSSSAQEKRFRSGDPLGPHVRGRLVRPHTRSLAYRDANAGRTRSFQVPSNSPLGQLAAIAERLGAGYHWLPWDAVAFVVTGRVAKVHPIVTRFHATDRAATSRITLQVDPRVNPETVKKAFESAQKDQLFADFGSGSRRLNDRTSALAVFLARHQDDSWRTMRTRWDAEYPAWTFGNHRAFSSDAQRAWQRVVGEPFDRGKKRQRIAELRGSAFGDFPPGTLALRSRLP